MTDDPLVDMPDTTQVTDWREQLGERLTLAFQTNPDPLVDILYAARVAAYAAEYGATITPEESPVVAARFDAIARSEAKILRENFDLLLQIIAIEDFTDVSDETRGLLFAAFGGKPGLTREVNNVVGAMTNTGWKNEQAWWFPMKEETQ